MRDFGRGTWADEISALTGSPEYQTATVTIWDPSKEGEDEYNVDTGVWTYARRPQPFYTGPARVIGVRWGNDRKNSQVSNPSTTSSVRLQIPAGKLAHKIVRGTKVEFTASQGNQALIGSVFVVTSDLQGSSSATRTFECELDGDTIAGN